MLLRSSQLSKGASGDPAVRCQLRSRSSSHDHAAQHIAVTAEVFRAAVDHEVDAEAEGALADRRGEGVVADDQRSGVVPDGGGGLEVRDVEQRIRGSLDPQEARSRDRDLDGPGTAEVDELERGTALPAEVAELFHRTVVGFDRRHQPLTRAEQVEYRHVGGEAGGERNRADATLEGRHARFQRGAVRRAFAAVAVAARVAAVRVAFERGAEIDGLSDRADSRIGCVSGVHAQRVEAGALHRSACLG